MIGIQDYISVYSMIGFGAAAIYFLITSYDGKEDFRVAWLLFLLWPVFPVGYTVWCIYSLIKERMR